MIRPVKHLNLNSCVIRAASIILAKLQSTRVCDYSDLRATLAVMDEDADATFIHAVHLLFLLGRVEYYSQTDSFEFLEPERKS